MDICKIGEKEYSVIVVDIVETFTKLYTENTGRTMGKKARNASELNVIFLPPLP